MSKKNIGFGVVHESQVRDVKTRIRQPIIVPVDIEVDEPMRRGVRRNKVRCQRRRADIRGELLPIFVMFRRRTEVGNR